MRPLQATDGVRDVLGSFLLQARPRSAWTLHTGVLHGAMGSLQTPRSKGVRQWGTASRGDWHGS